MRHRRIGTETPASIRGAQPCRRVEASKTQLWQSLSADTHVSERAWTKAAKLCDGYWIDLQAVCRN